MKRDVNGRKRIREALLSLMREKDFDKITVSDIIRRAEVSRTTYYYHYYLQLDVVDELIDELFSKVSEVFDRAFALPDPDYQPFVQESVEVLYNNREFLLLLFSGSLEPHFKERFRQLWRDASASWGRKYYGPENQDPMFGEYAFHGTYNIYKDWVLSGCAEPIDSLVTRLVELSRRLVGAPVE